MERFLKATIKGRSPDNLSVLVFYLWVNLTVFWISEHQSPQFVWLRCPKVTFPPRKIKLRIEEFPPGELQSPPLRDQRQRELPYLLQVP